MKHLLHVLTFALFLSRALYADDARSPIDPQQPVALSSSTKSPADHATLLHPDQLQTLIESEAVVTATDLKTNSLVVTDKAGQSISLTVTPNTRILDSQNRQFGLSDLQPKDHVRLYYDRKDKILQQIDRLPTVGEVILGK